MFLYIILYLLFFTNSDTLPSSPTRIRPKGTVHFKDLEQIKPASKTQNIDSIDQVEKTINNTSDVSSNISPKIIEDSLNLARAIFSHQIKSSTKIQPDSILVQSQPTKLPDISSSVIDNFKDLLSIYTRLKTDQVGFINSINSTFAKNYTFNTSAENVAADFIGDIFKEIVQQKLTSSFFNKNLELFLHKNLEKEAVDNYKAAESIQTVLFKMIDFLYEIKLIILNNENKELKIEYFNQSLPIDTWIKLTKKLSKNIESLIPQTQEEKDKKDIQSLEGLKEKFKKHQQIKSDWDKGLEDLFNQAQEEQEEILKRQKNRDLENFNRAILEKQAQIEQEQIKALEEDKKQKEAFLNKSKDIVEANTLKNLKQKINENFETLKEREKIIELPKELIKINVLLNTIKILLTDKKDIQNLTEAFSVLLSAVYQELISADILKHPPFLLTGKKVRGENEELFSDSYILKEEFNKDIFYKPLYNIIIYKLNTLLLLYATVISDAKLEKEIKVTLRFIESNEIKKYSFSTSILNLIVLNEQAEFFHGSLLKSKAQSIDFGKAVSIARRYIGQKVSATLDIFGQAGKGLSKAGEELINIFATPITWVNSFFEESQRAKEAALKKKEEEQQKLKDEIDAQNKLLERLIQNLNPQKPSKSITKNNSVEQETVAEKKSKQITNKTSSKNFQELTDDVTSKILRDFSNNKVNKF